MTDIAAAIEAAKNKVKKADEKLLDSKLAPSDNTTYTAHTYFDLFEAVDNITDEYLAARVSNSLYWRWDIEVVKALRGVYREIADDLVASGSVEQRMDAASKLSEIQFTADSLNEIASSDSSTAISQFYQLMDLRPLAIALAEIKHDTSEKFRGRPLKFDLKVVTIDERLHEERRPDPSSNTLRNIQKEAHARAEFNRARGKTVNEQFIDRYIKKKTEAEKSKQEDLQRMLRQQLPAIEVIYNLLTHAKAEDDAKRPIYTFRPESCERVEHFHQLDLDLQRAFILAVNDAAMRAADDARSDRDQQFNFDAILSDQLDLEDLLDRVLKAPKFVALDNRDIDMTPRPDGAKKAPGLPDKVDANGDDIQPAPEAPPVTPTVETHGEAAM